MKTAREHFASLSAPVGLMATRNAEKFGADLNRKYDTPVEALSNSFTWDATPQGHAFWWEYCGYLIDAEGRAKNAPGPSISPQFIWRIILLWSAILSGLALYGLYKLMF